MVADTQLGSVGLTPVFSRLAAGRLTIQEILTGKQEQHFVPKPDPKDFFGLPVDYRHIRRYY